MLGILLAFGLGLSPCPPAPPAGDPPPVQRRVEESFLRDPGPLDFIRGEGLEQFILQSLAGDALVGLDLSGEPVPRLAESWTVRGRSLRFKLRKDAAFPGGRAVRAEDVLWTLRTLKAAPDASPSKRAMLEGVEARQEGPDVVVTSPKPAARLLRELARLPVAREGEPGTGSGPFTLERKAGEWILTARTHFLSPRLPGFRFRLLTGDLGVLDALQRGWLHLGVPPARRDLPIPAGYREVRQAMHAQMVVWSSAKGVLPWLARWRRDAFPEGFLGGRVRASRGLWPETLGHPALPVTAAPGPKPARLSIHYPALDEMVQKALMALRARAAQDGVELELRPVEAGLFYAQLSERRFPMACTVVAFDPHPWAVLEYVEPKGPMNLTGWSHPRLGAWLAGLDSPKAPAWMELQRAWAADPGALPLLDLVSVVWVDRRLQVQPSPLGLYFTTPGPSAWRWSE